MSAQPLQGVRSRAIVVMAFPLAAVIGIVLAYRVEVGVGLTLGVCYLLVLLLDVAVGIALWLPLAFLAGLPLLWHAPSIAAILIVAAWAGALRSRTPAVIRVLGAHRRMLLTLALFLAWMLGSLAWARDPGAGTDQIYPIVVAVAVLLVVATMGATHRAVRLIVLGLVVGGAVAVLYGFVNSAGFTPASSAFSAAAQAGTRLNVGSYAGDPNYLAAALVPTLALAVGLFGIYRHTFARFSLLIAIAVLSLGLAATQSRGGFVGAIVAVVVAAALLKGRRAQLLLGLVAVVAAMALWFTANPASFQRVTHLDGGGTGRSELWRVAGLIVQDQPVIGVGLGGFRVEAPRHVRHPGQLKFVALIAERPHLVHNTYLQILSEDGVIGLALFLVVVLAALRAGFQAANLFDRRGDRSHATLARALLVGTMGMLASIFFLSATTDVVLWVLLALGPAMLGAARAPNEGLGATP